MKKLSVIFLILFSTLFYSCSKPGDLTVQQAIRAYQKQDFNESEKLFLKALEEESNYSREIVYNFLANLYASQGDLENSIVYQEKMLSLKDDYRGYVTLGMNYHLMEDDVKAEESYRKAISLVPDKGEAYASLGSLYIGKKKYSEAVEYLQKAAEFEPKIAVIHANLAVAYALNGQSDESEAAFAQAEKLKCQNLDEFRARALEK